MSPLYIGIIIGGVGLLLVLIGIITRGKAGRISAAPLLKTGDAARASGAASCEGSVRVQQALMAPCTSTPCVFYRLKIEKKVKIRQGTQTTTRWVKLSEQHFGSVFGLDDGSGLVTVQALDDVEGDLEQTYSGLPPGGPGLGALANFVTAPAYTNPLEEILEYRAIEKLIRADGKVFVLGNAQNGQLMKPGTGKMVVSTRGRDALVGSSKKKALAFMLVGGIATAGGATISILRPGEAKACGELKDTQARCAVTTNVVEEDRVQPDGSKKHEKFRREILKWEVTKAGKYKLSVADPRKGNAFPTIQVENSFGIPMNLGLGLGLGTGAYSFDTTTANLSPGKYTIYVFASEKAASTMVIDIIEAPEKK